MNNMKKTLLAIALATLSLSASAHRGWLYPQATHVEGKEAWVTIDGAISEGLFDIDHVALKLDDATVIDPDGVSTPRAQERDGQAAQQLRPEDGQGRYLQNSLVTQNIMGSYKDKAGGELKRFRGTEATLANDVPADAQDVKTVRTHARLETFVSANKQSTGAFKPTGVGLEMIPVTHPTDLRPGETATWRFQLDGKPLPKFAFSLTPGGVRYRGVLGEVRLVTDAKGEVSVKLPAAGMYWLHAGFPVTSEKNVPADAPADLRRFSYAATLEILPE